MNMPGIDPTIIQHHIPLLPNSKPIKQKLWRMRLDWALNLKEQVEKQFEEGFMIVIEYPEWIANIVPIPKKRGKHSCVC